jgi:hypothetical protein
MAKTDRKQGSPGIDLAGRRPAPPGAVLLLTVSLLAALWAAALMSGTGRVAYAYVFYFVEFYGGVFTLVGLSLTVMIGLLATDRLILQARTRVWVQSAHRSLGVVSIANLVFHVLTKVSEDRATMTEALLPFVGGTVSGQSVLYMGLGPIAAYLMLAVLWTGLIRRRFAGVGRPWMWRALHSTAYLAWPVALLHGLGAGRPPATWVTVSYLACVVLVAVALLLRLSIRNNRRTQGGRLATSTLSTGSISMRPVGRTSSTPAIARRREVVPIEPEPLEYEDSDTMFAMASLDPPPADIEPPMAPPMERPIARPEPQRVRQPQAPRREPVPSMHEPIREPMREPMREPVREPVREPMVPARARRRAEPAVAVERIAPSDPWGDAEPPVAEPAVAQPVWPRSGAPVRAEAPPAPRARRLAGEPPAADLRGADLRGADLRGADLRGADLRERPGRHADEYVAERRSTEPPRRRARSADEYLVADAPAAPVRDRVAEPRRAETRAESRAESRARSEAARPQEWDEARTHGWAESRSGVLADAREETRASARSFERFERPEPVAERPERRERPAPPPAEEPEVYRARATAPAPPYIPSPVAADDDVIMADMSPEFDLIPPDDTPTLVDLASRRAIRESVDRDAVRDRDAAREVATKSRRAARRKSKIKDKDQVDEEYWGFLRGEAQ